MVVVPHAANVLAQVEQLTQQLGRRGELHLAGQSGPEAKVSGDRRVETGVGDHQRPVVIGAFEVRKELRQLAEPRGTALRLKHASDGPLNRYLGRTFLPSST